MPWFPQKNEQQNPRQRLAKITATFKASQTMRQSFAAKKKKGKGGIKCSSIIFFLLALTFVWYSFTSHQVLLQNASSKEITTEEQKEREGRFRLDVLQKDLDIATEQMHSLLERLNQSPILNSQHVDQHHSVDSVMTSQSHEAQLPPINTYNPVQSSASIRQEEAKQIQVADTTQSNGGGGGGGSEEISQSRNPILFMSDEQLRSTPFDQLLAMYGPDTVPGKVNKNRRGRELLNKKGSSGGGGNGGCDYDFGIKLSDRWRNAARECCHPIKPTDHVNGTKFTCHAIKQTRHHGDGDQLWYLYIITLDIIQIIYSPFFALMGTHTLAHIYICI